MRKIIVLSMITLDGVMQAPGGPGEDTSGGFRYGGWVASYGDEAFGKVMQEQLKSTDLLLGRKTYDIFAGYWPTHENYWPGINSVRKYVLSNTLEKADWNNSEVIRGVEDIKKLKNSAGSDLQVHGSGELVRLLLKHDLVDELWLKTFPVLLGKGKKLFDDSSEPGAFELTDSVVTTKGVVIANYKRAGEVETGLVGE
ncbi:Dihydrofolate reductase [Chitinophaga terrae (ex Kim and Jung 2007)]|jgi:dihydrofolate reductase|uniref:Dihydrofolate reductase n=1 Tax=Chitinophaga terrae (ex Kim and Jung 2007) TaxID=408074 RepID=A0A1H4D773_9BACT|nr:dihydrofolate reductase family protein [Chitinophaga terrae (ex Kim and Jung 2007)]MDQ0110489.1 dihydrofolate reductase [Chitinophaga terrae (ex Kim and Jung 2007)]SEA68428.1 Dihydrofolate reductase [Chitinophaga terrae (ex Kim and Jung 2007)]